MSTVPVNVQNKQTGLLKGIVPDPRWFDRDRTKFEDQQRGIRLFLKSNRVTVTDDRITVILAYLRESIARIYTQKKFNELDKETDIQNLEEFGQEIKMTFSNKSKAADTK